MLGNVWQGCLIRNGMAKELVIGRPFNKGRDFGVLVVEEKDRGEDQATHQKPQHTTATHFHTFSRRLLGSISATLRNHCILSYLRYYERYLQISSRKII